MKERMIRMKKVLFSILAAVLLVSTTSVSAMTEDQLFDKLTAEYTINGETVQATNAQKAELERYLSEFDISSSDADFIAEKFDEILKIAQDGNASSFTDLTDSEVKKVVKIVSEVSDKTSVKVSLTEGGVLTIYDKDGKTPFTVIKDKDMVIQNTDSNSAMILVAGAVSLLGIAVITKKIAGANA